MTILCIETSTSVCSAAICKDGEPISQCICREGSNHARLLPRYIQQLLTEARQQGLTIEAVALSEGPGSYTGLRIGSSTAKGLCYGLSIPLIPVPTLEVLKIASGVKEGVLIPMIDARRMEVYTMIDGETKAVVVDNEQSLYTGDQTVYYFGDFIGDGAEKTRPLLGVHPNARYDNTFLISSSGLRSLAFDKLERHEVEDVAYFEPYYLKEFIAAPSHVKGLV